MKNNDIPITIMVPDETANIGASTKPEVLHAETNAISNALNHIPRRDLEKATLYIRRVKLPTKDDIAFVDGMAKPCTGCMRAIIAFGIKKVVYSTEEDGRYEMLLKDAREPINMLCS